MFGDIDKLVESVKELATAVKENTTVMRELRIEVAQAHTKMEAIRNDIVNKN